MKIRLIKCAVAVWAFTFSFFAQAGSGIILDSGNLNAVELSQARRLVDRVEEVLPEKVKDKIASTPVRISFRNLGDVFGAYSKWGENIMVNTLLLTDDDQLAAHIREREEEAEQTLMRHDDLDTFKVATILHEIIHHYDRQHFKEVKFRRSGEIKPTTRTVRAPISGEDWFKNAIGLPVTGLLINTRTTPEKVERRAPDPYEWKNSAENFAVNMEFFLLDEEYRCNRPFQYRLYKDLTNHDPFPTKYCENPNKVFSLNHAMMGVNPLVEVDPERVYGLHYFFAGEGEKAMSKYGHAMMRLIVCKPGRRKGPDCLKDLSHHLVLSYAALIDDDQISTIKGLKGDYAAVLNVAPLTHMIQKYTETELREVYSYPIKMSEEKIRELVALLQERHWNYSGNYKFLSNNCADETLGFLKALFYDRAGLADKNVSRPDTLRDLLKEQDIIQTEVLDDKEEARAKGFYFPSNRHFYQDGLDHLYEVGILLEPTEVEDYFKKDLKERREYIELALMSGNIKTVAYTVAVERVIYKKSQMRLIEEAKKEAMENIVETEEKDEGEFTYLVAPVMMLDPAEGKDYGVPSMEEMEELQAQIDKVLEDTKGQIEEDKETLNKATKKLKEHIGLLGELIKELLKLRRAK